MTNKTPSPIDLNTASENELVKRLKITARQANRIIALRPYQSVDQLKMVWGIDPEIVQRILPAVTVHPQGTVFEPPVKAIPNPPELPTLPKNVEQIPETPPPSATIQKEQLILQKEAEEPANQPDSLILPKATKTSWKISLALVLILIAGAYFRFTGLNWDQNQHQHPDERFISMTAGQLTGVKSIAAYFDTQTSTLNPLNYGSYTYGMFPLFFTWMAAEWLKMSSYDTLTLVGRAMSGLFDLAAVWMLYLLGKRLYDRRIGLLAAALGAAAVLPIQLSHYFAVDSFSTVFVIASFYFAILAIPIKFPEEKPSYLNLIYFGLFGVVVGLAVACKVNTLPVFGIIALAGIAKIITNWKKTGFGKLLKVIILGWLLAGLFAFLAFRVFQPYAFAGPGFFGIGLNQAWLKVIQDVTNQVAGKSDWPPNTHWTNRSVLYAWTNMVTWGLGLPLGLAGWLGWAWAAWRIWKGDWRRHLLPFVWVAAYFIWQNVQFWRYMRYFLPIYPIIILFAAWALVEIYDRTRESRARLAANGTKFASQFSDWRSTWKGLAGLLALGIVLIGTFGYALAFTRIYNRPMTRIAASDWILANIPGPLNVIVDSPAGNRTYPISVDNQQVVAPGDTASTRITILQDGTTSKITTTDVRLVGVSFYFRLTNDEKGTDIITEGRLTVNDDDQNQKQEISFGDLDIKKGETYYFSYKLQNSSQFSLSDVSFQDVNQSDTKLPINLNLTSQTAGLFQDTVPLSPDKNETINRLEIGNFHQVFLPTETTLKVSIFGTDNTQLPLAEASQTLTFSKPGMQLTPTFNFTPVNVTGNKDYQIAYEIPDGTPVRLLSESYTLETSWDDALPLNVDGYEAEGGIYNPLNLELYDPDTPEKRDSMIQILSESDYIVIPSNRAYDAMPRMPLRYPLTLKYYQALFGCNCSGNALESRAAGLEAPFKSPLGFDLVATFESPPSLGLLAFPDQLADESFTVYDHPKVMVFKKDKDFSIERVSALLNSVDLNNVVIQTPMQYTQDPTALQLPADRLVAQTNGGTWSSMFNRNALINVNEVLGGFAWYLLIFFLGLIVFPFVFCIFSGLPGRGYPLIRIAGLILMAWLPWALGSLKILPFSALALWLCTGLILILSAGLAYRQRKAFSDYFRSHWKYILVTEGIFLVLFLFSLFIHLGNPDLWNPWLGGEKPMDFSFFNAVLKSVYFPPENPWFSGHTINYYYYGYVLASIPTKLLGILPSIAFNLILPSWFAMTGIGVFCLGFDLVAGLHKDSNRGEPEPSEVKTISQNGSGNPTRLKKGLPYLAGIIALVAVLFLGNLYEVRILWEHLPDAIASGTPIVSFSDHVGAVIGGAIQVLTGQSSLPGGKSVWYFDASRPILHNGPDTPIAEFPYFTFLYGDLHAHLLTLPIYALALGWMLSLFLWPATERKWSRRIINLIAAGLIFGVFRASHTWDFPTFLGLGGLVVLWDAWRTRTSSIKHTILVIIGYELAFLGIAIAFYWPFAEWFKTEYTSLQLWTGRRTPLIDYLFVFGLTLFVLISLLIRDLSSSLKAGFQHWVSVSSHWQIFSFWHIKRYLIILISLAAMILLWHFDYEVLTFGIPILAGIAYIIFCKRELSTLRRITWILFGIGLSITLFVEVFVLTGDVGRSNTVFKFYDQAWFIFGLAISLALIDLFSGISHWSGPLKYTWSILLGLLVLGAASYALIATNQKMTDRWPDIQNPPHTLDGAAFMLGDASSPADSQPAIYNDDNRLLNLGKDYAAIMYMQDHVVGSPVIVEGHTEEYRWGSRFSIYTGLPSVVGWSWHIRQQDSLLDGANIDKRIDDVNNFYNTADIQTAQAFLKQYQVQYIIVGDLERAYYDTAGISKFQEMVNQGILQIVFGDDTPKTTSIFKVVNGK
jgi:YYY domain-containing protein